LEANHIVEKMLARNWMLQNSDYKEKKAACYRDPHGLRWFVQVNEYAFESVLADIRSSWSDERRADALKHTTPLLIRQALLSI
jgi:hypothetical protein